MAETTPASTLPVNIEDEMRRSYLDYSMSVIVGRALPDVRDGLKPVHRRVLFAMQDLGNTYNRAYKKSARIVGDVIGKYHPHGDSAVYDTIVRLAQDFSMRYPLVDGQGNFGSIDGDSAAAMRYTEIRMDRLASELLADIDKETVDFGPNYDDSLEEPLVLPARFPNLLVNGAAGIAVGMATNIPPHNMGEILDATIALIENPELTIPEIMRMVPGPDFPTGGYIHGVEGIRQAFETGRGSLKMRAKTHFEPIKGSADREQIVATELPYQVNKARLLEKIAELVREKKIEGISDLRDESDREGLRVVIELKRDAIPEVVRNNLFKQTLLQSSFGVIMLALDRGQPKVLDLKSCLERFIDHRREVVTRRSRFELRKAEERFHLLTGLLVATDHIDRIVDIIRTSADPEEAKGRLCAEVFKGPFERLTQFVDAKAAQIDRALEQGEFRLDAVQAQAILDMRLARLTGLEREKIENEMRDVRDDIVRLKAILGSDKKLLEVIVEELRQIREQYADDRRTQIVPDEGEISLEDLIADEDMVVTISHTGYIKRNPVSEYRAQKRGGRGRTGAKVKDEDFVEQLFVASTHTQVLCFTSAGKCYWLKVHEIPMASRTARGKPVVNLLNLAKGERLAAVLPVKEFVEDKYIAMVTAQGIIKKTELSAFGNPRAAGIIALNIDEGDRLIAARLTDGTSEILVTSRQGLAIRFKESDVRAMGRTARGVKAITLGKGDEVVGATVLEEGPILTITENGYGKRTPVEEYRIQSRGGKGIITIKTTKRNGEVVGVGQVKDDDQIMLVTNTGMLIRMKASDISVIGRNTQGVRLISLESREEKVSGFAWIAEPDEDDAGIAAAPVETAPEDGADGSEPDDDPADSEA
jgi:DNA gyrase subunit A